VGLEGAAGLLPVERFRRSTQRINQEVGSFFLNAGLISGGEYAGFASKETPRLFGVEDRDLYLKNVAAVRASLSHQKEALKKIETERARLQIQKREIYSPALL